MTPRAVRAASPAADRLPDVSKNWPLRYLVTNSGWGTGMDVRPNPGIGFPGYANYFPVTRGMPQPPSIRHPVGPGAGPDPVSGRAALRRAAVRAGRHAAVSGPAAGAAAGQAARARPAAGGIGAVRAAVPRDASDCRLHQPPTATTGCHRT